MLEPRSFTVDWQMMFLMEPLSNVTRMVWWLWKTSLYGDWCVYIQKATVPWGVPSVSVSGIDRWVSSSMPGSSSKIWFICLFFNI